jgi:hypothetical protein
MMTEELQDFGSSSDDLAEYEANSVGGNAEKATTSTKAANQPLAVIQLRKMAEPRPAELVELVREQPPRGRDSRRETGEQPAVDRSAKRETRDSDASSPVPPAANDAGPGAVVPENWKAPPVPVGRRAEPMAAHLRRAQEAIIRRRTWLWALLLACVCGLFFWRPWET